ncbi:MAG TPA: hypothetical protein VI279_06945 [Rhodocyclaceae bacterium]
MKFPMRGGAAPASGGNRRRTLVLGLVALALTGLTIYDYSRNSTATSRRPAATRAAPMAAAAPGSTSRPAAASGAVALWREILELRHFRAHADLIRQRYQAIAGSYAELVAPLATLGTPGAAPKDQATLAIQSLLSPEVKIKDLLVAEQPATGAAAQWAEATLSLSSGDSQAMARALVALGDAGNGMIWKELAVGVDTDRRSVQAKGKLALLLVRQAE